MQDEPIRAFFAITLDDVVKNQLCKQLDNLKNLCPFPVKWVKHSHLHLTLCFLESISFNQLDTINHKLQTIKFSPFNLEFQNLIFFPEHKPRIIAVAVSLSKELASMVHLIQELVTEAGVVIEEREFLPHITLGRVAKPRRRSLSLREIELPHQQKVPKITLFKSDLTPDGSVYTVLKEFQLGGQE